MISAGKFHPRPSLVSVYFSCCSAFKCCPSQKAHSSVPAGNATCVDKHTQCPQLKLKFDQAGLDCFTTDVGAATNSPENAGKHLVDDCCLSCSPPSAAACDAQCKGCMLFGTTHEWCPTGLR